MKTVIFKIMSLLLAAVPMTAMAQTNIQNAFDAIIKCKDADITNNHTIEKDPQTNVKKAQSYIYNFVLPNNKLNLIKDVEKAFDKDAPKCYGFYSGKAKKNESAIRIAVGDGSKDVLINDPNTQYVYATFLAPQSEDNEGIYRYAYAMNYREDGGKLIGKLVITYATTLKHRQQVNKTATARKTAATARRTKTNTKKYRTSKGSVVTVYTPDNDQEQPSWLDMVMSNLQSIPDAQPQTRIALAKNAYKVIRDKRKYPEVSGEDRKIVKEILVQMLNDKRYSETILRTILKQSLDCLR